MKAYVNLWDSSRSGRNGSKSEAPKFRVVFGELTFPLEDLNENIRLIVHFCCKHFVLARGDRCIAVYEGCHDASCCLYAESERRNVEEDHVLELTSSSHQREILSCQDPCLHCRSKGNCFVRIHVVRGFLAVEVLLK
mmetsp:Transcript_16258/g.37133  ORF Transcript_16258/g.37133 Transcript_16258/m.37133 type:complete len:137 (+) Transcript_16258:485-895(+)